MPWEGAPREERRHNAGDNNRRDASEYKREPFQKDRDRILFSSAFRRLNGVTQIVRTGEADVFHTRLAHTLKVAQVGRRLAERIRHDQPKEAAHLGVDAEVVEAACLAHDLGHPPFGHVAESELDRLVQKAENHEAEKSAADDSDAEDGGGDVSGTEVNGAVKKSDGYEGNPQSFRVLTRLSILFQVEDGLNLTRATLAAALKYPWMRDLDDPSRSKKWGAYSDDLADFTFAREGWPGTFKTAEAELMDWADDIAYSIHDLEDFHRCQALDWNYILSARGMKVLSRNAADAWHNRPDNAVERLNEAHDNIAGLLRGIGNENFPFQPYEATKAQRQDLRVMASSLVDVFIHAISLVEDYDPESATGPCVVIEEDVQDQVRFLKQITKDLIIGNPALAAQQRGQRRIIEELFEDFSNDVKSGSPTYLPRKFVHLLKDGASPARIAADAIASLTEAEAVALHARLRGWSSGSVLDPIVR